MSRGQQGVTVNNLLIICVTRSMAEMERRNLVGPLLALMVHVQNICQDVARG